VQKTNYLGKGVGQEEAPRAKHSKAGPSTQQQQQKKRKSPEAGRNGEGQTNALGRAIVQKEADAAKHSAKVSAMRLKASLLEVLKCNKKQLKNVTGTVSCFPSASINARVQNNDEFSPLMRMRIPWFQLNNPNRCTHKLQI
jgi:hypothetical protein